jgi:hypothetical protein
MRELVAGRIFVHEYPVRLAGGRIPTRMTLIVLADGGVVIHSPVPFDDELHAQTVAIGDVRAIFAPSNCHHLFVPDAHRAFPDVPIYAVPGLEKKRPDLPLRVLPDELWSDEIDRVHVGNRVMHELVLFHRASRTVIATDLVENFRDETPGVDWLGRAYVKMCLMWNKPRPAPELRMFTRDRAAARRALERMLAWDFDRMVIAHGELFEHGAKSALREAWRFVLGPVSAAAATGA